EFRFDPPQLCYRGIVRWGFSYRGFPGGLAAVKDLELWELWGGRPATLEGGRRSAGEQQPRRSDLAPTRDDLQRYTGDQGRFESRLRRWSPPSGAPVGDIDIRYTLRIVLADDREVTIVTSVRQVGSCLLSSLPALFRRLDSTVVVVLPLAVDGTSLGQGSGVVLGSEGIVATAQHVVSGAYQLRIRLQSGRSLDAVVLHADQEHDIALLLTSTGNLVAAELGNSDSVEVGESVVAIGNPLGEHTLSTGIISGVRTDGKGTRYIQTTAPVAPGSSGGPLLNMRVEVIGLTTRIVRSTLNALAVPSNHVRAPLVPARGVLNALQAERGRSAEKQTQHPGHE